MFPAKYELPFTLNLLPGVVVPIPTLPVDVILNFSVTVPPAAIVVPKLKYPAAFPLEATSFFPDITPNATGFDVESNKPPKAIAPPRSAPAVFEVLMKKLPTLAELIEPKGKSVLTICNLAIGLEVPIPMLPVLSMVNLAISLVNNCKALASRIPN